MVTEIINLKGGKNTGLWDRVTVDPRYVYIGRGTCFTPFPHSKWHKPKEFEIWGREGSIEVYREYILDNPSLLRDLPELKDKILCCWCKPKLCHGDVLIELLEEIEKRR